MSTYFIEIIVFNDIGRSQGKSNLSIPTQKVEMRAPVAGRPSPVTGPPWSG
jgi:hypothetical protein